MIVDTGASITSISTKDGSTIGLDYPHLTKLNDMIGVGGKVESYELSGISLLFRDTRSSYHVERLPSIVALRGPDLGLPSLLGADILRKYKVYFDGRGAILEK
jgi:Aspartyl protease